MYQSPYQKQKQKSNSNEEATIASSFYTPNERIVYKGHRFTVKYSLVRNDELQYLMIQEKSGKAYFVPELLLAL